MAAAKTSGRVTAPKPKPAPRPRVPKAKAAPVEVPAPDPSRQYIEVGIDGRMYRWYDARGFTIAQSATIRRQSGQSAEQILAELIHSPGADHVPKIRFLAEIQAGGAPPYTDEYLWPRGVQSITQLPQRGFDEDGETVPGT